MGEDPDRESLMEKRHKFIVGCLGREPEIFDNAVISQLLRYLAPDDIKLTPEEIQEENQREREYQAREAVGSVGGYMVDPEIQKIAIEADERMYRAYSAVYQDPEHMENLLNMILERYPYATLSRDAWVDFYSIALAFSNLANKRLEKFAIRLAAVTDYESRKEKRQEWLQKNYPSLSDLYSPNFTSKEIWGQLRERVYDLLENEAPDDIALTPNEKLLENEWRNKKRKGF